MQSPIAQLEVVHNHAGDLLLFAVNRGNPGNRRGPAGAGGGAKPGYGLLYLIQGGAAGQSPGPQPLAIGVLKTGIVSREKLPGILLQTLLIPGAARGDHISIGVFHHHLQ